MFCDTSRAVAIILPQSSASCAKSRIVRWNRCLICLADTSVCHGQNVLYGVWSSHRHLGYLQWGILTSNNRLRMVV